MLAWGHVVTAKETKNRCRNYMKSGDRSSPSVLRNSVVIWRTWSMTSRLAVSPGVTTRVPSIRPTMAPGSGEAMMMAPTTWHRAATHVLRSSTLMSDSSGIITLPSREHAARRQVSVMPYRMGEYVITPLAHRAAVANVRGCLCESLLSSRFSSGPISAPPRLSASLRAMVLSSLGRGVVRRGHDGVGRYCTAASTARRVPLPRAVCRRSLRSRTRLSVCR